MKLNRRGLIATIIYHLLLLLLLLFAGLKFPDPPPEEEGILVNFGTGDTGFGQFEPMGDNQQAGDPELPVADEKEQIIEESEPVQQARETVTPPEPVKTVRTQDVEETAVREKPTPEEVERQRLEQERIEKERLEKERLERERLEQERIERERQQQAERLNNLGRNAFGNQGVGETEGSQGEAGGGGNQGDINGSPDADRYGTGGGLGEDISFGGLGSRRALGSLPKPDLSRCEVTQKIEVTVEIQVDRDGRVLSAVVTKASVADDCIWNMVVEAAGKSRFSMDQNANYRQTGWIKYIIVP
jgi:colicin import membrane protein